MGKTSLLTCFLDSTFSPFHIPTVGIDFRVSNKTLFWDAGGSFETIHTSHYLPAGDVVVIVFDVTRPETFDHAKNLWLEKSLTGGKKEAIIVLVGNKCDDGRRCVPFNLASDLASMHTIDYLDVSAKTDLNVDLLFSSLMATRRQTVAIKKIKRDERHCTLF